MPHPDAKERLARALRDALTTVPLSKVTVSGITRTAGVTRQAFYYHFSDIRDLTVWVFKREVADQIIAHATYDDWSDGLLAMFVWMQKHPEETRSVISSLGMEDLQIFLHKQLRGVMEPIVDQHSAGHRRRPRVRHRPLHPRHPRSYLPMACNRHEHRPLHPHRAYRPRTRRAGAPLPRSVRDRSDPAQLARVSKRRAPASFLHQRGRGSLYLSASA